MNDQHPKIDRLSSYLKALSSNYAMLVANVGTYAISVPLLLRWLGSERYGLWLIFLQLSYLASLATTWISVPIVREAARCYVEKNKQHTQRLFQTVALYYLCLGVAMVSFMIFERRLVPELFRVAPEIHTDMKFALVLLSVYIAGTMQLSLLVSLLIGFQQMHIANLLLGTLTVLGTGIGVSAMAGGWGLSGLATGQVAAMIVIYCIAWLVTHRIGGVSLGIACFDCSLLLNLLRSGAAYAGYSISHLMLQSDILLIGLILGSSVAAIYGIAYKVMDYAVQLIWKIPDSLLPMIAELDASKGRGGLQRVHRLCGTAAMAAALLAAIITALYGHLGVVLWVGVDNAASQRVFIAFSMIIVLQVLVHSSLLISYGTNRMGGITWMALIEGALKIALAIWLLPRFGMIGVALGTILAQMCVTAWYVPLKACRITGDSIAPYVFHVLTLSLPAAITAAILASITLLLIKGTWHQLLISLPMVAAVYLLICLGRGLSVAERRWKIRGLKHVLRI